MNINPAKKTIRIVYNVVDWYHGKTGYPYSRSGSIGTTAPTDHPVAEGQDEVQLQTLPLPGRHPRPARRRLCGGEGGGGMNRCQGTYWNGFATRAPSRSAISR